MNANKEWALIKVVKDAYIYRVNDDRYVVTRCSYNKTYGYSYTQESYNTYEDAVAAI